MFYRGDNFPGISRETKYWCFSSFTQWKRQVIESLLSLNIPTVFEMEYVWTKEETFVTIFLLLHNAALLAKKSDCFRFILKGDIYTIKWAIVLRAGFWLSKVYCLIAYFLQGRNWQKFCNPKFLVAMASNLSTLWPKLHWLTHANHKPISLH